MSILQVVILALLIPVLVSLWLPAFSELVCLLRRRAAVGRQDSTTTIQRLLFLVPAHNEELLIAGCVRSLLAMSYPADAMKVVVVADNCDDGTVTLAADNGAMVLDRRDPEHAGKPRAIAWALAQLDLDAWDAVVIVDADSVVDVTFASELSAIGRLNDIVFQPNNLVMNEDESWLTRLGGLLGRCRFYVTFPLKQSVGLNCPVANGMGIGTGLLIRDGWQSTSITEDSELYVIYTVAGVPIRHARRANIYSQESRSLSEGATQRRRWLAGRIRVIHDWGWRIIASPRIGWHQKLDVFVEIALCNPVLHLLVAAAVALAALWTMPAALGLWIAILAAASLSALAISTMIVLWAHPHPWATVFSFALLPVYAVWRLGVLARTLITLGDISWRRSARTTAAVLPASNQG
jgi:cellulose synthase/poly-beta-1,6-N-acetylglucosamine synthase-like glycosyltransferase